MLGIEVHWYITLVQSIFDVFYVVTLVHLYVWQQFLVVDWQRHNMSFPIHWKTKGQKGH